MIITSPLFVMIPRKTKKDRKVSLNLNIYRNLHHFTNNEAKRIYKELMKPQLENLKFNNPITITYVLVKRNKRKLDRANVLSIVDKFFCDALVDFGCIKDDSDEYIEKTSYYTSTNIDSKNPRVEILIEE